MTAITAQELEAQMPDATQLLSDEPEMESSLHYLQLMLLVSCLELAWQDRRDFFIGANLTIYFSRQQLKNRDFGGPDFFLVKHTERKHRNSWVVWEEDGQYPDLIIELLSNSTVNVDRHLKRKLYAERFHTPEYFYFSPDTLEFAGFRLALDQYQPIVANEQGWLWSEVLGLFLGVFNQQLRYFTLAGALLPTPAEALQLEVEKGLLMVQQEQLRSQLALEQVEGERQKLQQQAEQDRLRLEQEAAAERSKAQEAEAQLRQLREKLQSLGITLE